MRPRDEEAHRLVLGEFRGGGAGIRQRQRLDWKGLLAAEMEEGAAGRQHLEGGAVRQQVRHQVGHRRGDVLAVVEQEEGLPWPQKARQRLLARAIQGEGRAERRRDRGHERGIGHRGKVDPYGAVVETVRDLGRDGQRQPRLAHATGTGQRQERDRVLQQIRPRRRAFSLPADEPMG
jgi:hypothetical protein